MLARHTLTIRRLLVVLCGVWQLVYGQALAADYRALVIGIDTYIQARPLERAVADARAVATSLRKMGYAVEEVANADRASLLAAVKRHSDQLSTDSQSLVFFAGHGIQVNGVNYLLPRDVVTKPSSQAIPTAVSMTELLQLVSAQNPRHSVVILDACRDFTPLSDGSKGIASILAPKGFYIVYSAGSGETALDVLDDDDKDVNGLFTRKLLRHLTQTNWTLDTVIKQTRREVRDSAKTIDHSQVPAIYDQSVDEIYLVPGRRPVAAESAKSIAAPILESTASLSIGVGNYAEPGIRLENATRDARMVAAALAEMGVQSTPTLIDPTLGQMRDAIAKLATSPARKIIVYYAGMGTGYKGDGYLLGTEWRHGTERIEVRALSLQWMVDQLRMPGRRIVLLVDADHSARLPGASGQGLLTRLGKFPELEEGQSGDLAILYASGPNDHAADAADNLPRSPFEIALVNALAHRGLTIEALAKRVSTEVRDMTQGNQIPVLYATPRIRKLDLTATPVTSSTK